MKLHRANDNLVDVDTGMVYQNLANIPNGLTFETERQYALMYKTNLSTENEFLKRLRLYPWLKLPMLIEKFMFSVNELSLMDLVHIALAQNQEEKAYYTEFHDRILTPYCNIIADETHIKFVDTKLDKILIYSKEETSVENLFLKDMLLRLSITDFQTLKEKYQNSAWRVPDFPCFPTTSLQLN